MIFSYRNTAITVSVIGILALAIQISSARQEQSENKETIPIGGQLDGLTEGKLALELKGAEELLLEKNGAFFFKTRIAAGAGYSVQVKQLPANHLCEVINGSGTADKNLKVDLTINCNLTGRWVHPKTPDDSISSPFGDVMTLSSAMDDSGDAILAWSQFDGSNWRIYMAEYREGKWQKPTGIADALSLKEGNAKEPRVAMSSNGDAVIVWEQMVNKQSHVFMAEKRGGKWRKPASINDHISPSKSYAWEPEVAMDNRGNTVIVWDQEHKGGYHDIYKSEYRNDKWSHPAIADHINPSGGDGLRPRVVMNNKNEVLITWEQDPGGNSHIYKSEYRNGVWSHPKDIKDHINPDGQRKGAHLAMPAMNDKGEAVIAWEQAHGNNNRIYLSEYRNGKWKHPSSLAEGISPEKGFNASLNDIALDSSGNGLIIWRLQVKGNQALYKSEYRNGAWNHPQEDDFFSGIRRPFEFRASGLAAMSDSGKSVVVWQQMGADGVMRAFYVEYDNGNWHFPGKGMTVKEQQAIQVNAVGSKNGSFVMSWTQRNNSGKLQVYASLFKKIDKR